MLMDGRKVMAIAHMAKRPGELKTKMAAVAKNRHFFNCPLLL
jgi:hypothetical protein